MVSPQYKVPELIAIAIIQSYCHGMLPCSTYFYDFLNEGGRNYMFIIVNKYYMTKLFQNSSLT